MTDIDFPVSRTFRRGLAARSRAAHGATDWTAEEEAAYKASFSPLMRMTDEAFLAHLDEWWREPPESPPDVSVPPAPLPKHLNPPRHKGIEL